MRRRKKRRSVLRKPELTVAVILAWADAHCARTGVWPTAKSEHVHDNRNESWARIDDALRIGLRGLPGGSSLARLLDQERGVRNRKALPPLTEDQILRSARGQRRRTGQWPTEDAGPIPGTRGEVWGNVAAALARGCRGLPGGDTLARLLARRLDVPNPAARPKLTESQILGWADAFHTRTGGWPCADTGPVAEASYETWQAVDDALRVGLRGLAGGSSLAQLLAVRRGVRNRRYPPPLTVGCIRIWAHAHQQRTRRWPNPRSGAIPEAPGETWAAVDLAMRRGSRGLPGGGSLYQLRPRE